MLLADIIEVLTPVVAKHPNATIRHGFDPTDAHSWRGDYSQLSFVHAENVRLADMLKALTDAIGETYEGYKGGEFTMDGSCSVYMDGYGTYDGNAIGWNVVRYWIDEAEAA